MDTVSEVSGFSSIDEQADPEFFVDFVDRANQLDEFIELENVAMAALRLPAGGRALDLGCGTGEDTRRLASLVGPEGEAVGVDASEAMLTAARQRTDGTGLRASFTLGDAAKLDFPDASFDAVRAERLLIHVPEPELVLSEMARVTRPGGRVVVIDTDFDTWAFDLPDTDLDRRVGHAMTDSLASGRIGRQMPRLLREAGLVDVACHTALMQMPPDFVTLLFPGMLAGAVAAGLLDQGDSDAYWKMLAEALAGGDLLGVGTFFVVSATKP